MTTSIPLLVTGCIIPYFPLGCNFFFCGVYFDAAAHVLMGEGGTAMEKRVLIWDDGLNYVNYMEALRAVDLTPVVGREAAGPCAALLLPGGGDIADRLPEDEIRTIRAYAAAEKPILGICRCWGYSGTRSARHLRCGGEMPRTALPCSGGCGGRQKRTAAVDKGGQVCL